MASAGIVLTSSSICSSQCFRSRQSQISRTPVHLSRCLVTASAEKVDASRLHTENGLICITCSVQGEAHSSRRDMLAGIVLSAGLIAAAPARAGLFGGPSDNEIYTEETTSILKQVEGLLVLEKKDPARPAAVQSVRSATNKWVAKYRRGAQQGKPSFGTTYTVLNALAGHFNSFGNNAPLPKKRLDRIVKEVADAEKLLARNR